MMKPMKYLGIDYGRNKVGLAVSDEGGKIAFPKEVIANRHDFSEKIKKICQEEEVSTVVLGESLDSAGEPNEIMTEIISFKEKLEKTGLVVVLEKEFMTTLFARLSPVAEKPVATPRRREKKEKIFDAKAAALILQRYLDRIEK
jgi:putative Holliday junction resolvase